MKTTSSRKTPAQLYEQYIEEQIENVDPNDDSADPDQDKEDLALAAIRHRSYLPLVKVGLMTPYQAIREAGANHSADGLGIK